MKNLTYLILLTCALAIGCKKSTDQVIEKPNETAMPDTAIFSEVWHDWEISKTKMDSTLGTLNLYFLNEKIGYSAGGRGLYKTIDAGQSWQKININSI